ncbi:hypothetical protein ISP15_03210 [Dyella jejuensis]|uniref:Stress-induced acidophilic repeat motif-containing protein n=1 Tax=Dyella jejuensis TaxID=1432009 RepID=A0ABW8JE15_9GAMM
MVSTNKSSGGGDHASHEQHVKAGEQSHKNTPSKSASSGSSSPGNSRGGSPEQHAKAGQQSHKNDR